MKLLQLSEPPDAILTSNSLLAAGALQALLESQKAILEEIGRTAAELLIKRNADPTRSNREVILKAKLFIRQSCGCQK